MQSLNDDERKIVLGEVLADELKVIREYVEDVPSLKKDVIVIKENVSELKSDMKVVKTAVTDVNKEQKSLKQRVAQLEAV